jgi:hypothetical protein
MIKTVVLVAMSAPYVGETGYAELLGNWGLAFEDVFGFCPCLFGVALGLIGAALGA